MSQLGERIAAEARALVGISFRLQGRDPATGLDCVGLVALALARARGQTAQILPLGYALRNSDVSRWLALCEKVGLTAVNRPCEAGDVIHTRPGPAQDHLLITGHGGTFIEAHAGLRRVVETHGPLTAPILHHWRAT